MRTFDVTLNGFDARTDATDHLIKWVRAENRAILSRWLKACGLADSVRDITDSGHHAVTFDAGLDVKLSYVMPAPGESCAVQNFGEFFQITEDEFDAENWIKESQLCLESARHPKKHSV